MRKLIALEFVSLDGVIQAPGAVDEDPSGGFAQGGWMVPYSDPVLAEVMKKQMNMPLGGGKRLFAGGAIPAAFEVTESVVTSRGVVIANFERAGAIATGR